MGVKGCNRKDCINILCDRYSPYYGYICNECFEELVNSGFNMNIFDFMNTPKRQNTADVDKALIFERYNRIFPR
jgi:hypothetical protein